jgi:hypothetical protein
MSGKKETVLDLGKYIDKGVRVKLSGGREGASREFRAPIPSVPKRGDPPVHPSRRNRPPPPRRRPSRNAASPPQIRPLVAALTSAPPSNLPFPDPVQ